MIRVTYCISRILVPSLFVFGAGMVSAQPGEGLLFPSLVLHHQGVGGSEAKTFIADFDGDGDQDIAICTENFGMSVYLNAGDGVRYEPFAYALSDEALAITGDDFDGDGDIDFAIALDGSDGEVAVMLNQGDGSYASPVDYPARFLPTDITTGDINGDGIPDIIATDFLDSFIVFLYGNGDGTFMPFTGQYTGDEPFGVAVGDLNNDGNLDIVSANTFGGNMGVRLNNGDGTFSFPSYYPSGAEPRRIRLADIDNDGDLDAVVVNRSNANARVFKNQGDGTFVIHATVSTGFYPVDLQLIDLDQDLDMDLIVINEDEWRVKVLMNNGSGDFAPDVEDGPLLTVGSSLSVGDMNGDGFPDIVAGIGKDRTPVAISFNNGVGTFESIKELNGLINGGRTRFADLNNDGMQDVISSNNSSNDEDSFTVGFGTGDGRIGSTTSFAADGTVLDAIPCDLDEDGSIDIVVLVQNVEFGGSDPDYTVELFAYLNDGLGGFTQSGLGASAGGGRDGVFSMNVGDFDGDGGRDDFVVMNEYRDRLSLLNWDAVNGWVSRLNLSNLDGGGARLEPIDYDGDGDDDFVSLDRPYDRVMIRHNNGNFDFVDNGFIDVGENPYDLVVADLDHDSDLDIVVLCENNFSADSTLGVILNNGNGFDPPVNYWTGYLSNSSVDNPQRLAIGDLNNDSHPDIVVGGVAASAAVIIQLGDGHGAFTPLTTHYTLFTGPVELVDLNMDNRLDIVVSSRSWPSMVLLNQGGSGVCVADLTGDGELNFFDVSAFLSAFTSGDLAADFNGDGELNFFDVSAFLGAFVAGCP